jgi:hypothetical protein
MVTFIGKLKEDTVSLWQMINLYFFSPWQIHYSVFNGGELWEQYPSFAEFLKSQNFHAPHSFDSAVLPHTQHQDQDISQFLKSISFCSHAADASSENFNDFVESQKKEMVIYRGGYFLEKIARSIRTVTATAAAIPKT